MTASTYRKVALLALSGVQQLQCISAKSRGRPIEGSAWRQKWTPHAHPCTSRGQHSELFHCPPSQDRCLRGVAFGTESVRAF